MNGTQILAEYIEGFMYIIYIYDAEGSPIGMMYREYDYAEGEFDVFWYEKNLQGDVIAVYNSEGTVHLRYTYDAWGNVTTSYHNNATYTGAQYNPFTYRGYYRDSETGFYYLNSRYYDPIICRFINSDVYTSTGQGFTGCNMFVYCGNDPINRLDESGTNWFKKAWKAVKNWCSNTFGAGVVQRTDYKNISSDTILVGYEDGFYTSKVIAGDVSKPISVYVENASTWWKFWEYKVGVQINTDNGGAYLSLGVGEVTFGGATQNSGLDIIVGIDKIAYTTTENVDFKNREAGLYQHGYIRTIPAAAVAIVCYYAPQLIPVIGSYAFA